MTASFKNFKCIFLMDLGLLTILYLSLLSPMFFPILKPVLEDLIVLLYMPSITLASQIVLPMFGRYIRYRNGISTEEIAVVVSMQSVCTALFYVVPVVSANMHSTKGIVFILLATAWSTLWFLLSLLKAPLFCRCPAIGKILVYAYSILLLFSPDFFYIQANDEGGYSMSFLIGVQVPALILSTLIGMPLLGRQIKRTLPILSFGKRILLSFFAFISLTFSYTFTDICIHLFYFKEWDEPILIIEKYSIFIAWIDAVLFLIVLCIPIKKRFKHYDETLTF